MSRRSSKAVPYVALGLAACLAIPASAEVDWPGLRGPNADGTIEGKLFDTDRIEGPQTLELAWKVDLGSGYSSVVVGDGRVMTLFAEGDADYLAAFDTGSGEELWRYRISDTYSGHDGSHDGPISTPVLTADRVYGLGAWGDLFALDVATGKEIWKTHLKDDHGGVKPHYGFSTSPTLVDGILIVQLGAGEGKSIAGLDAATGAVKWALGDEAIQYHSPTVAELGGKKQVLAANMKYLYGVDPATGEALWSHEHGGDERAMGGATIIPVPAGADRVFVLHKQDSSTMLQVGRDGDAWTVEELWSNNTIRSTYVNPVYYDGHLYGIAGRILTAVDAATGERVWRSREPGDGFPTVVGDKLVIMTKPGSLHVAEASPAGYQEIASIDLFDEHSWSEVAYADGSLFARSMGALARVDAVTATDVELESGRSWLAGTRFGSFLSSLDSATDKQAAVEKFMAEQDSFPIIEPTGAVHFVYRGEANDVGIVSDVIGFRREDPMTHVPGTDLFYFSARLEPDAAGTYGFLPDYPEAAIPDPHNDRPGNGLFGEVSFFSMPAWTPPVFTYTGVEANEGTLEDFEWESAAMEGAQRSAKVYLPAGYADSGDRRYPVVYIHGGQEALEGGQTPTVLDHSIGTMIDPVIAVFILPDAENPRADQRSPEQYGQMVVGELVPAIDGQYRTLADRHHRATAGVGDSGTQALMLALHTPQVFGKVAAQGPTFIDPGMFDEALGDGSANLAIYHSWGTYHLRSPHEAWDMVVTNRKLHDNMRRLGYRPTGGEVPDGFGWSVWTARTDDWLAALFPRTDDPA